MGAVGVQQKWRQRAGVSDRLSLSGIRDAMSERVLARRRVVHRQTELADQLAPAMQLVVGNLRIGRNVLASLEEVSDSVGEPLGGLLREVVAEAKLGAQVGDVLLAVAQRERNRHLAIIASALVLHGRHGGSLVEILETVIETVEEEDKLRRDMRAVTADGRLSAAVLLAMPPFVLLFVSAMDPGYAAPLVTTPIGLTMSAFAIVLGGVGWRWLHVLSNPEISL
jgi:tight adherence protein B